jgi:hypothetical protein
MVVKPINQLLAKHSDKIVIFIFPILLAFLNPNWIFTPATDFLPDAWFYFAYFRYFYAYAPVFPSNTFYFVERLTWNVPGYYIYKLFPPLQANYVLHLIVCYIALFSLYGTLQILFNRRTALLSALLLGGYPWFLRAVGWDYVDGIGIAHMLLLIYILTLASRSRQWKLYLLFAGIVYASLIITNPFWLIFSPGWAIYFFSLNYPISKTKTKKIVGEIAYFMFGNLILAVIIAIFYHSVTGDYAFLQNTIAFSFYFSHATSDIEFVKNLFKDIPPFWHVIPILVGIGSILRLGKILQGIYRSSFIAVTLLFLLSYSGLILWHFRSSPFLNMFPYSSFLIPSVFLLLGGLLAESADALPDREFNYTTIAATVILAAPYILVVVFPFLESWQGNIVFILLFCLIFLVSISILKKKALFLPILIAFSILSFLAGLNAYVFLSDPLKGQNNFVAIIDASTAIDSYYPNHKYTDFRIWFREDKNYNTFFDLSSIYLYPWGSTINNLVSGGKHPISLSFPETDHLQNGDNIVLVTSNSNSDEVIAEANHALAYRNAVVTLEALKQIQEGPLQFTLYFTKIKTLSNK